MASLITCPVCSISVADNAKACPGCGTDVATHVTTRRMRPLYGLLLLGCLALLVYSAGGVTEYIAQVERFVVGIKALFARS